MRYRKEIARTGCVIAIAGWSVDWFVCVGFACERRGRSGAVLEFACAFPRCRAVVEEAVGERSYEAGDSRPPMRSRGAVLRGRVGSICRRVSKLFGARWDDAGTVPCRIRRAVFGRARWGGALPLRLGRGLS